MNIKGLNLLVDKRNSAIDPLHGRLKMIRLSAIILLFTVGTASVILSILIALSPLPMLLEEEQRAKSEIEANSLEINKYLFINERSRNIESLFDNRQEYASKLNLLSSKLPSDVRIDGFTLDQKTYSVKFTGTNLISFQVLLEGINSLSGQNGEFVKVFITSLSFDIERGRFELVVDLQSV